MTQNGTVGTVGGNTSTPTKKSRSFCFTLNNPVEAEIKEILWNLEQTSYIFQEEIGESGTYHIQGCFRVKNPMAFKNIKKFMPRAHIEKCKSWKSSVKYCCKDETRKPDGKIWNSKDIKLPVKIRDIIKSKGANKFQEKILKLIQEQKMKEDDRTVNWVFDKKGNIGKTALVRHICLTENALLVGGKKNDILYGVSSWIEKKESLDILLINLARDKDMVSYEAIEVIKDGIFYNSKYESGMCIFNPPVVIVFANCEPDYDTLTKDRWNLIKV